MSGKEYRTITDVKGPLVFLNKTEPVAFGEIVQLRLNDGTMKNGQVLDTSDELVVVQVFEGTAGVDLNTGVKFMGDVFKLPVSDDLIGRILDGAGRHVTVDLTSLRMKMQTSSVLLSTRTHVKAHTISFKLESALLTAVLH